MHRYSWSEISDHRDCPRRAVLDRLRPKPQTLPLEVGSLSHELAWRVFTVMKAMPEPRDEKECRRAAARELLAVSAKASSSDVRKEFEEIGTKWLDEHPGLATWKTTGFAEKRFAFTPNWTPCAWDSEKARFRGIIDRLDLDGAEAEIADYKTSRKPIADYDQLEVYAACLLVAAPAIQSVRLRIEFMRYLFSAVEHRSRRDLDKVLVDLESEMERADQVIEVFQLTGEVDARPNAHCGSCAHIADCPALLALEAAGAIAPPTTLAEAQECVRRRALHEAASDLLKTYIDTWVETQGPIPVENGKEIRIVPSEHLELEAVQAFDWATDHGIDEDDIWPLLSINKGNATKLAAIAGEDLGAIAKAGRMVPGASVRKVKRR